MIKNWDFYKERESYINLFTQFKSIHYLNGRNKNGLVMEFEF